MKTLKQILESKVGGEWCLWDYKENGVREILVWKGDGKDQSDVTEIDEKGVEIMNVDFGKISEYCKTHKDDPIDKWHLDISNANISKIPNIF